MALTDRQLDKRLVRREITRGRVDEGEYRKHIEALPDVSDNIAKPEEQADAPAAETEGQDEQA